MLMTKSMLRDLISAQRRNRYEVTENGIYLPDSKLHICGAIMHDLNGGDVRVDANMVVLQGRIQALISTIGGGTQISSWFVAPFANSGNVQDSWDASNFTANAGEFLNYTETTRQALTLPDPTTIADDSISNSAAPAYVTIGSSGGTTIWGAGIISNSAKSNPGGKLFAAVKFSAARSGLQATDVLGFKYTLDATSA